MKLVAPIYNSNLKTSVLDSFRGLNRTELIKDGEFSDMRNLSSDKFPSIAQRGPRSLHRTLLKSNGYYVYEGKHYYVDGTGFYQDGVKKGDVADSLKQLIDFNDFILIFPDKKVYDIINDTFSDMPSGTYPDVPESVPDVDYVTTHMNRVFGVKDREVYACEQGQYGNWAKFDQLLTDSYATDIESGKFTGLTSYANHVVMFTESSMYELYGYNPSNFQIQETSQHGLINDKSIVELNAVLYFANSEGIFAYSGGLPRNISKDIDMKMVDVIAGTDGKKLYCSINNGQSWGLYVYNPTFGTWHKEDDLQVDQFTRSSGDLFAIAADGKVHKFNSGSENINWEFTTNILLDGSLKNKSLKKLSFLMDMEMGSSIFIYAVTGGEDIPLGSISAKTNRIVKLPISMKAMEDYQIKVVGIGGVVIKAISRVVSLK